MSEILHTKTLHVKVNANQARIHLSKNLFPDAVVHGVRGLVSVPVDCAASTTADMPVLQSADLFVDFQSAKTLQLPLTITSSGTERANVFRSDDDDKPLPEHKHLTLVLNVEEPWSQKDLDVELEVLLQALTPPASCHVPLAGLSDGKDGTGGC